MKINTPSYEKQNEFIGKYIAPILIDLDFGKVIENYKGAKKEKFMKQLEKAGVYKSLEKLETKGTGIEQIWKECKDGIESAERMKEHNEYKEIIYPDAFERNLRICNIKFGSNDIDPVHRHLDTMVNYNGGK